MLEMQSHLESVFDGLLDPSEADSNAFDFAEAIYWFASDYHGGQWSNLYETLSASEYRPGPISVGPEPDSQAALMYAELESEFAPRPVRRKVSYESR